MMGRDELDDLLQVLPLLGELHSLPRALADLIGSRLQEHLSRAARRDAARVEQLDHFLHFARRVVLVLLRALVQQLVHRLLQPVALSHVDRGRGAEAVEQHVPQLRLQVDRLPPAGATVALRDVHVAREAEPKEHVAVLLMRDVGGQAAQVEQYRVERVVGRREDVGVAAVQDGVDQVDRVELERESGHKRLRRLEVHGDAPLVLKQRDVSQVGVELLHHLGRRVDQRRDVGVPRLCRIVRREGADAFESRGDAEQISLHRARGARGSGAEIEGLGLDDGWADVRDEDEVGDTRHLLRCAGAGEAVLGGVVHLAREHAQPVRQHVARGDDAREEELDEVKEDADARLDRGAHLLQPPRLLRGDGGGHVGVASLEAQLLEHRDVHARGVDLQLEGLAREDEAHRLGERRLERLLVRPAPRVRREQLGHVVHLAKHRRRLRDGRDVLADRVDEQREHVVLVARLVMVGVDPLNNHLNERIDLRRLRHLEDGGERLRILVQNRKHALVQLLLEVGAHARVGELEALVSARLCEGLVHQLVVGEHQLHLGLHVDQLHLQRVVHLHLRVERLLDPVDRPLLVLDHLGDVLALRLDHLLQHVERRLDRTPRHGDGHHRRDGRRLVLKAQQLLEVACALGQVLPPPLGLGVRLRCALGERRRVVEDALRRRRVDVGALQLLHHLGREELRRLLVGLDRLREGAL
mmetsp:Transcript_230/g.637  ORF Transcript_230/g.637 Transcript_230/m.637 type:complete len:697 (+) Transcript_230:1407-3497(+)